VQRLIDRLYLWFFGGLILIAIRLLRRFRPPRKLE